MSGGARAVALKYLLRAQAAGQYANIALDTALKREVLSEEDKRLATALFYSVLEHRITLDAVIDRLSSLPPSAIEREVRMILRMGLAQLLYFDRIPMHAAINEAVAATPRRSKGFVNAILRQFCREGRAIPLPPPEEAEAYISVKYSVCPALARTFLEVFGAARTEALLTAFAVPPAICVRVNTTRISREAFLARIEGATPTKHAPFGVILPPNTPLLPLIDEGLCFVQDEASQIAVAALDARCGMRVIDLCAAPGSKSFGAAIDMDNRGDVMSFDLHANKLSLVREGAKRLGLSCISAEAADARSVASDVAGTFDRVICDVPCSGFGVLGKKPDLRYKDPETTKGLIAVGGAILSHAATLLREDGVLVYSTCTLLPEENEQQVGAFLETHKNFSLLPFTVGGISCKGMLTMAPDTHGTDGFFVAKLQKKRN